MFNNNNNTQQSEAVRQILDALKPIIGPFKYQYQDENGGIVDAETDLLGMFRLMQSTTEEKLMKNQSSSLKQFVRGESFLEEQKRRTLERLREETYTSPEWQEKVKKVYRNMYSDPEEYKKEEEDLVRTVDNELINYVENLYSDKNTHSKKLYDYDEYDRVQPNDELLASFYDDDRSTREELWKSKIFNPINEKYVKYAMGMQAQQQAAQNAQENEINAGTETPEVTPDVQENASSPTQEPVMSPNNS